VIGDHSAIPFLFLRSGGHLAPLACRRGRASCRPDQRVGMSRGRQVVPPVRRARSPGSTSARMADATSEKRTHF